MFHEAEHGHGGLGAPRFSLITKLRTSLDARKDQCAYVRGCTVSERRFSSPTVRQYPGLLGLPESLPSSSARLRGNWITQGTSGKWELGHCRRRRSINIEGRLLSWSLRGGDRVLAGTFSQVLFSWYRYGSCVCSERRGLPSQQGEQGEQGEQDSRKMECLKISKAGTVQYMVYSSVQYRGRGRVDKFDTV